MSAPPPRTVELVACESCGGNLRDEQGRTRGEQLLSKLRERAPASLTVTGTRCLWNCKRSCSVHVRSPGRSGYVLTDLEPSDDMAQALLDWSALYHASADGAVPFRTWPVLMKGHFLCRLPPAPEPRHDRDED